MVLAISPEAIICKRQRYGTDSLISTISEEFQKIPTPTGCAISTHDCLMSGMMIFGLKCPSWLQFEARLKEKRLHDNLTKLYKVDRIPRDTTFRERVDLIDTQNFRGCFTKSFAKLQRGKVLDQYRFLDKYYLCSMDGTGFFSSHKVRCEHCCVKNHRDGTTTFYHQCLSAVIVHPNIKQVIPLMPEFIQKQDGETKNDCERNAAKRLLIDLRREHPHLKLIIVEDGLASNGPHLKLIDELDMRYIIVAKEADHKFMFDWFRAMDKTEMTIERDKTTHHFSFANGVPLNHENFDYKVNVLEYRCKKTHYVWVTNFEITQKNAYDIMRGGRARWKIENETFNTLKNQGYEFEHNYGHGYENLSNNMAILMLLAFFIDQVQMLLNRCFQAAKAWVGTWRAMWEDMRAFLRCFDFHSWDEVYMKIAGYSP